MRLEKKWLDGTIELLNVMTSLKEAEEKRATINCGAPEVAHIEIRSR